jgi:hypothetical protein
MRNPRGFQPADAHTLAYCGGLRVFLRVGTVTYAFGMYQMETTILNPDCEIEQLLFHMKLNGIRPNSNSGRILLWLENKGPGEYSIMDIASAIGVSVRQTRLSINLVSCAINGTKLKFKYNILISGKSSTAVAHFARL